MHNKEKLEKYIFKRFIVFNVYVHMGTVPKKARGVRSHGAGDAGKMLIHKIIIYILKKIYILCIKFYSNNLNSSTSEYS